MRLTMHGRRLLGVCALRERVRGPGSKRAEGFTLIEVLVVVAIIALLIAILLPALRAAREQARTTVCMSQMKEFGLGFEYYASAHRQNPPPNRQYVLNSSGTRVYCGTPPEYRDSDWWYYRHMVPRYIPPGKLTATGSAFFGIFACPADQERAGRSYSMNIFAGNFSQDGVNANFATKYANGEPFNPHKIKSAYRYMLLAESFADHEDSRNRGYYGTDYVIGSNGPVYGKFKADVDFTHHRDRANFLFADLHVDSLRRLQVVRRDTSDRSRWLSTLAVLWSPDDRRWNVAMPE